MAVEDAEAPRRQHEEAGAREQDAHDGDRQHALLAAKSGGDEPDEKRCRHDAGQHEHRRHQREQGRHGPGDSRGSLPLVARDERRVDRDERRRQRPFAEQVLQEVWNAERRHECIGGVRLQAEVMREHALADEAGQPAAQDAERDERG